MIKPKNLFLITTLFFKLQFFHLPTFAKIERNHGDIENTESHGDLSVNLRALHVSVVKINA
jgi:hypothetical protein